jgi:hypothetical protein
MTARPTPLEPVKSSDETQRERPGVLARGVLATWPEPAGVREIRHPRCGAIHVEVEHVGEQDRVQVPVREMVERAELVGDRVDVADARLGEGEAGEA